MHGRCVGNPSSTSVAASPLGVARWTLGFRPRSRRRLVAPGEVTWDRSIIVPFAPETLLSGVAAEGFFRSCWYRRTVEIPPAQGGERIFLMFGAVDHSARVWVDGSYAGCHEGGYTPFSIDITDFLLPGTEHEVILCAEMTRTTWPSRAASRTGSSNRIPSGIPERPASGRRSGWSDDQSPGSTRCGGYPAWRPGTSPVRSSSKSRDDLRLEVILTALVDDLERHLAHDVYSVVSGEVHRRIALSDPGIDDFRNELLWSPASPTLIDATLRLLGPDGEVIDEVFSYTALRAVGVEGDRFVLNNRALNLRLVLDQGYWPDSGMTAPDGNALRRDVELAKAMGFNGVRKHQKIEDPRYLYWADRLGLLVWEEMPSAYRFTLAASIVSPGVDRRAAAGCQPSLCRHLGAFQRVLGGAGPANASAAAALYPGALPSDEGARSDSPRCRQRRMGERRNRHHRRP